MSENSIDLQAVQLFFQHEGHHTELRIISDPNGYITIEEYAPDTQTWKTVTTSEEWESR